MQYVVSQDASASPQDQGRSLLRELLIIEPMRGSRSDCYIINKHRMRKLGSFPCNAMWPMSMEAHTGGHPCMAHQLLLSLSLCTLVISTSSATCSLRLGTRFSQGGDHCRRVGNQPMCHGNQPMCPLHGDDPMSFVGKMTCPAWD